jgi:C-terminal duplication domain of Friend of PRMT1
MAKSRSNNNKSHTTTSAAVSVKDAPQRKARNNSKVKAPTPKQEVVSTKPNRSKGKKNNPATAATGRGGSKGKGGGRKGANNAKKAAPKKPLTAEQLDKQMDDYMMRNEKTAEKILEEQMDDYWAKKGKKDGDEAANDEGDINK